MDVMETGVVPRSGVALLGNTSAWRGWIDTAGIIALLLVLQGFGVDSFLSYLIVFAAYVGLKFWRDL